MTSGTITDEMINEYINEQEGETLEDDSRFQIDPLEPLALQARVVQFARLYRLTQAGAFFIIRPKSNTAFQRVYSRSVDKTTGLRCDQTVRLTGVTVSYTHLTLPTN